MPSVPTDIAARDGRPNKKSKWDKVLYQIQVSRMRLSEDSGMFISLMTSFFFLLNQVDGDVKNPPLAAGTNAAPVSSASAGSGYSAFA